MGRSSIGRYRLSWCGCLCAMLLISGVASPTGAQTNRRTGTPILAGHVGATAVGTGLLFFVDEPLRDLLQANRNVIADRIASVFRQLGEYDVVYPASLGVLGLGFLTSDSELKRSGVQMAVSLTVASGFTIAGKFIFGRARPDTGKGAWSYEPFSGVFEKSLPSGHTALAFALTTTLADFTDDTFARSLLYAAAAGAGWSRMNDDRHWLSDVGLGAVIGIMSSKLTTGRWTLLGIETPDYLANQGEQAVNLGEVALGAAAGIAIVQAARLIALSERRAVPFVAPLGDGAWGTGLRMAF